MISKLYCTYINHVAIPKKRKMKIKKTKQTKKQQIKQKQQHGIIAPCLHHLWRCYQAIALNDQQVGPTSLASLSP